MANLIQNPGFESSTPPSVAPNWGGFGVSTVNNAAQAHTGNNYASFPSFGFKLLSQAGINVTSGTTYTLSFWINPLNLPKSVNVIITGGGGISQTVNLINANVYTQYSLSYTPTATGTVTLIFFGNNFRLDDVSLTENVICYRGDTKIFTKNLLGEEAYLPVKQITKDNHQVYSIAEQKFIPIIHNVVTGPYGRFRMIKKDLFDENKPSEDTYFTSGHKIIYHGKETKVKNIPGAVLRRIKPEEIYTIVTKDHNVVLINNIPVVTFSQDEWSNYQQKKSLIWSENSLK